MISFLREILTSYQKVEQAILYLIGAQFCLQLVNAAFFLLLNFFMVKKGYQDYQIANILSYRFFAVLCLALPLGLFIKGRQLKPFFLLSTYTFPIFSLALIYAVDWNMDVYVYISTICWGLSFTLMQATILPFILLNADEKNYSEGISLMFLTFSVSMCAVGFLNMILHTINPIFFDEKMVLILVSFLSLMGIYFISKIRIQENVSERIAFTSIVKEYDWGIIAKTSIPTIIIAVGAGFTIPVINLFFLNVHGISSDVFSKMGAFTFLLVVGVMLFMPYIRRQFGYMFAIVGFQSFAIIALFILATTEYYNDWSFAVYIAIGAYIIRQPLMSAANPMTSELTTYYVGAKNQEMIGALNASIWSGSWFVSTKIFAWLRLMELRYVSIFMITVAMYVVGVCWYFYLVKSYERRKVET